MALDVLLQVITEEGDAEARRLLEAARAEADAIRASADARTSQRIAEAYAAREAGLRQSLDAKRSRALTASRVRVLQARTCFIDQVLAAAEAELPGVLERSASVEPLTRLCAEALEYFPAGAARIRLRAALARRLSGNSWGAVEVGVDDTVPEGVIVESLDGSVRVDNTLAARLHRRRPELAITLLRAASEGA
jgi:vacuolar-type H+-ATPase subunit E/Vma4